MLVKGMYSYFNKPSTIEERVIVTYIIVIINFYFDDVTNVMEFFHVMIFVL